MKAVNVWIEDEIRDERVYVSLDLSERVAQAVEKLVWHLELPQVNFALKRIDYELFRAGSDKPLPPRRTLSALGIQPAEVLRLVSPEGRRVWQTVRRILDEIEDQIKDAVKDRLQDEAEEWIKKKLEEVRQTRAERAKLQQVEHKVSELAGQPQAVPYDATLAAKPASAAAGGGLFGKLVVAVVVVVAVVGVVGAAAFAGARLLRDEPVIPPAAPPPSGLDGGPPSGQADRDGDGLTDAEEDEIGTDPDNPDSDEDGLWDGDELDWGTDPWYWDTDDDGYSDGQEVHELSSDPLDPNDPGQEAACQDDLSVLIGLAEPPGEALAPGTPFTWVWRVRNTGTCTWQPDRYTLVRVEGDALGGPDSAGLSGVIEPGTESELSVALVAPSEPGVYTAIWQMFNDRGQPFGDEAFIEIAVGEGGEPGGRLRQVVMELLEQGYTRFAILQVLDAPLGGVEEMAAAVEEAGGEVVAYEVYQDGAPVEVMGIIGDNEPEVVLLYAASPDVIAKFEEPLLGALFDVGLDYALFYAVFPNGDGFVFYEP